MANGVCAMRFCPDKIYQTLARDLNLQPNERGATVLFYGSLLKWWITSLTGIRHVFEVRQCTLNII